MAFSELLRLLIEVDDRGAVRNIQNVAKATDKSLTKSQQNLDKLGRSLTVAGAGMVAFGAAGLLGLGKAAQASEEARLSQLKLENTLTNMPQLAGENSKSFIDLAESIQSKTAADADQIVEAEALLGTFRLTGDEIRKITPLVVDYSRKFGVDMTDAAKQVGKALDGQIGALRRSGVSIDENLFKTDRYAAVTKALRDQVGGFAEAEGATFAGSLERLKNQLGDLAEGVGSGAVDAFGDLFGVVDFGVDKLNDLSPAAQNAIGKFATFGSVALVAAGGLSFTIGQVITMRQRFAELGDAVAAARLRFAGLAGVIGPLGVGAALVAAGAGFAQYLRNQNEAKIAAAAEAFAKLRDVTTESAAATLKLNDAVKVSTTDFTASASAADEFAATGEITNEVMRDLDKHWGEIIDKSPQFAEGFIRNAEKIGVSRDKLAEWRGELDRKIDADREAVEATDQYNDAVQGSGEVTEDSADAFDEATEAINNYKDALHGLADPLFAALDASRGVEEAKRKEAEAQEALNEALKGGDPTAIAEATRNLEDAQIDQGKAALNAEEAMVVLKDAMDRGIVTTDGARQMLQRWQQDGAISAATAAFLTDELNLTADAAQTVGQQRPVVYVSTAGIPQTNENFRRVKAAAATIPRLKKITITADGSSAIATANGVKRYIDGLTGRITIVSHTVPSHQTFGGGQAAGGPIHADKWYVVGEQGPEIFAPGMDGTIIPNTALANLPTSGVRFGTGATVVNHFHMEGAIISSKDDAQRWVAQAWNKAQRTGLVNR